MSVIFDVAINDKFGGGADFTAQLSYFWDQFVMSGDFTHFFAGAEMYGEGCWVLG